MSDVSWDDDDFEPKQAPAPLPSDKWDGEDEDEVKDNWDDEEEKAAGTNDTTTTTTTTTQVKKKKKKLGDIIAEKEAKQHEEAERRRREMEEMAANESSEGKLAEKLRLQKVQEDADLELATDLLGEESTTEDVEGDSRTLDGVDLSTTEGLSSLRRGLIAKIRETDRLEKRPAFVSFVEDLTRDLCQNLDMEEVKRVTAVLNTLYNEKMRANKPKSKKKQLGKAKLNVGSGPLVDDFTADYDDFI